MDPQIRLRVNVRLLTLWEIYVAAENYMWRELSRSSLKKCELEVQDIIHFQNVVSNLLVVFADPII